METSEKPPIPGVTTISELYHIFDRSSAIECDFSEGPLIVTTQVSNKSFRLVFKAVQYVEQFKEFVELIKIKRV